MAVEANTAHADRRPPGGWTGHFGLAQENRRPPHVVLVLEHVRFLLWKHEYPLGSGVTTSAPETPFSQLQPSPITITDLGDGAAAIDLLRQPAC
jgi:hypothetical protein